MTAVAKKEKTANAFVEGVIWKQLLRFFFPMLLGTLFQQLYSTADAMIVGKFVGKEALAAVGGTTGSLINLIVGFFVGLSSGATVIISQFFGARNDRDVSRTVHTAMALAIAFGLIITALGLIFSPMLLSMLETPEEIIPPALDYLNIYFLGMVPSLIYNVGAGILRAIGDSRRPLYFLIAACLTNVVLDLLLVAVFHMGTAGAALATIISQVQCAVLVLLVLIRSRQSYHLDCRRIRFHKDLLGPILRIGLPAGLQSMMFSLSNLLIQGNINSFGTDTVAAWSAWGKIEGVIWMVISSYGIAITTFVGQNFGAQQYDRIKKGVRQCWLMTFGSVVAVSALMLLFGEAIYRLFVDDQAVIDIGMRMVRLLASMYFTYVSIEMFSGALRGMGDSLIPTLMTLGGICLIRVLWLKLVLPLFPQNLELSILCYPITWVITSLMFLFYYLKGHWMPRCQKKAGFLP